MSTTGAWNGKVNTAVAENVLQLNQLFGHQHAEIGQLQNCCRLAAG